MDTDGTMKIIETCGNHPNMGPVGEIRLVDDGPGIAEDVLEQIFDPFFTTKEEGTGLGLSIVKKIIEEHRGQIDVSSEKGLGTSFIIALPVKE